MGGRALGAAFVLLVGSALAAPRAQHAFADVFPEDTALWFGVDDLSAFGEGFAASPFGALLADPDFAPFMEELQRGLLGAEAQLAERWGVDLAGLRAEFRGAAAFGVCELVVDDSDAPGRSRLVMALLLELDPGAEARTLEAVDALVEALVDGAEQDLSMRFGDIDGTATSQVVGFDTGATLSYTATDGALVFLGEGYAAQDDAGLHRWLDTLRARGLREGGAASLLEAPEFVAAGLARVGAPSRLRGFARLPALVLAGSSRSPQDIARRRAAIEAWGLDACGPLAFEQSLDADGLRQQLRVTWGAEFRLSEFAAAVRAGGDPRALHWIPPEARSAWAFDSDPGATFDALLELLSREEPDAARDLVLKLAALEAEWGLHPRDDLLEALDGQFGWYAAPQFEGADAREGKALIAQLQDPIAFVRSWTLMLGLRDVDMVRGFVEARLRDLGLHVAQKFEEFEGYRVAAVPLPWLPGLSVSYALTEDLLVVGLDADQVRQVLRRRANPKLLSLADDPEFIEVRAALPPRVDQLQVVDLAGNLALLAQFWEAGVASEAEAQRRIIGRVGGPDLLWGDGTIRWWALLERVTRLLPNADVFERHLRGANLSAMRVDAERFELNWIVR